MFKRTLLLSTIFTLSFGYCVSVASNTSNDTIISKKVDKSTNTKVKKDVSTRNAKELDNEDAIGNDVIDTETEYDSDANTEYESEIDDYQDINDNKNFLDTSKDKKNQDNILETLKTSSNIQDNNSKGNLSINKDKVSLDKSNKNIKNNNRDNFNKSKDAKNTNKNTLNSNKQYKSDNEVLKVKNNNKNSLDVNNKNSSNNILDQSKNNNKSSLDVSIGKQGENNMLNNNFNRKLFEDAEKLDTSDSKTNEKINKTKINARRVKWNFAKDIWIVDRESDSITFEIRFKYEGCRNFAKDPGLLFLIVSNILEDTNTRSGQQIKELIENKSVSITIHGDVDDIILTVRCLNKYFKDVMDLICDILTNANFPEDKLKQSKEAIVLEYKQAMFSPDMLADEKLRCMTFAEPYRRKIDEVIKRVPQYDRKYITDSYNKLFNPENVVITIVGNIKADKAENNDKVLIEEDVKTCFDELKKSLADKAKKYNNVNTCNPGEQTTKLEVYKNKDGKEVKYEHVKLDNPQSIVMFALPGVARTDSDKIAIRAVNRMFGRGDLNCRLMKNIREQNGLVYGIYTQLHDFDLQSVLVGKAATRPDNVNKVIDEIKKQVTILRDHGIREDELKDFKINKCASHIFATSYALLNFVVGMRQDGIKINEINNYLEKYLNLTIKDINKALMKVFDPNKLVFVSCGMDPKVINDMKNNKDEVIPSAVQANDNKEKNNTSKTEDVLAQSNDTKQQESKNKTKIENVKYDVNNQINIKERVLENGMRVIVAPLNTENSVCFGVGYFVGGFDDPRTTKGLSHFVEHMMFKQTENLRQGEIKHHLTKYNKYTNAFTDYNITFYTHQCNKTFLELDMQIEADRMVNIQFDPKEIDLERGAIIEERKMRFESDPAMRYIFEAIWKSLYLYSPYSDSLIGYMDQIQACNAKNLKEHYDKYYMPNNAFALFVGDIDIDEATELCNKYFGNISKGPEINRDIIVDPEYTGITNKITHKSDQITTTSIQMFYKIPKSKMNTMKKWLTISIAKQILAGGESSILYKTLVEDKKILHTISSELETLKYDASILSISAVLQDGKNINDVEKEINKLIEDFINKTLTKDLFNIKKQKYMDSFELMLDNQIALNEYIIFKLEAGYSLEEIKNIKNILNSITYEDVKAAASDILDIKNQALVLYQMPDKKEKQNIIQEDKNKDESISKESKNKEDNSNKTGKEKIKDKMTDGLNKAKSKFKEIKNKIENKNDRT